MKKLLAIALSTFLLAGCGNGKPLDPPKTYPNIEAVWFHENDNYSFTILENGKFKNIGVNSFYPFGGGRSAVFPDLKPGEPMWARVSQAKCNGDIEINIEIHVHSIKDLQPAGWNHGKFGSGTTSKIEQK